MNVKRLFRFAAVLWINCLIPYGWAQSDDTISIDAGYSLQTDSNLFRLPASTLAQGGAASETEHIGLSTLGLRINKPYSLQRFELDLDVIDSKYQNATYLSFTAHNASATWHWSVTPKLYGQVISTHRESLNNFADNPTLNVRNQRTDKNTRFDATYELFPAWHILGGVTSFAQNNVQPLAAEGDISTTYTNAGLRHVWASGTTLTYTLASTSGRYTNRTLQALTLLDDSFKQTDNGLQLNWPVSGKSRISVGANYIDRRHPHFSERNYSGVNTVADISWAISGKSTITAGVGRELASYQSSNTNFIRTDRLTFGPAWQITAKTKLTAKYELTRREYLDSPAGGTANMRSDITRDASLAFEWLPYQQLTLTTTLQNAQRVSNQTGFDYRSTIATFAAQYSF